MPRNSIKAALLTAFMEFSHCYNAYFPWRGAPRQGKVQGFCVDKHKTLALEQSQLALKAKAFKAYSFVQYALYKGNLYKILISFNMIFTSG